MVRSQSAISDQELLQLSAKNPELRFERNRDGTLLAIAPTGGISGNREAKAGAWLLTLETLQEKMQEYTANGVRLGWLMDRHHQQAWVYRADGSITQYPTTATLSGEEVVPGFTLVLQRLL